MESDHILPVIRNWIAGFFLAVLTVLMPLSAILSDRVKLPYEGTIPSIEETEKQITQP
jgi:hypothetical protein